MLFSIFIDCLTNSLSVIFWFCLFFLLSEI